MGTWTKDVTEKELKYALENVYMLACRKRAVVYRYLKDGPPEPIGPKSTDEDWDHIKRFCEQVGLRPSILRAMIVTSATLHAH